MKVLKIIIKNIPPFYKWLIPSVFIVPILAYIVIQVFSGKPIEISLTNSIVLLSIIFIMIIIGIYNGANNTIRILLKEASQFNIIKKSAFVAAPMNAFYRKNRGNEYIEFRNIVIELLELLKKECNITNFYYAGQFIKEKSEFQTPDVSIREILTHLSNKEYFILIYPEKNASSSALIEAGIAIAQKKKLICFLKSGVELPFLLKNIPSAFHNSKIYEYEEYEDLRSIIINNKWELFTFAEPESA